MAENATLKFSKKKCNRQNLRKLMCFSSELNCSAKKLSETALLIFSSLLPSIESG